MLSDRFCCDPVFAVPLNNESKTIYFSYFQSVSQANTATMVNIKVRPLIASLNINDIIGWRFVQKLPFQGGRNYSVVVDYKVFPYNYNVVGGTNLQNDVDLHYFIRQGRMFKNRAVPRGL